MFVCMTEEGRFEFVFSCSICAEFVGRPPGTIQTSITLKSCTYPEKAKRWMC